jgi:quinol monooxygenase YgiN
MSRVERAGTTPVNGNIQVSVKFPHVSSANLADFKQVAARAMEIAEGEPGVLQYDWYLDDTETVCLVHETYRDSEALLAHIANVGDVLTILSELGGGCELEMFGDPSPLLLDATPPSQRSVFRSPFQRK